MVNRNVKKFITTLIMFLMLFTSLFSSVISTNKIYAQGNNPPVTGEEEKAQHPENPGDVMLFKEAEPVEGMVNVWDITLRIEGKDTLLTSDIVLVIDTSGSMSGNKMTSAINAAKSFVDTLLPSETTRIGIVPFASEVGNVTQLTNQVGTLIDAIEALAAVGGTFTQAGVKQAEEMLAASAADMKHIVLLSDGRPTYSYDLNNRDDYLIPYGERNREIGTGAPSTAYTSTQVGDGGNLREYYGRDWVSTGFLQGYWSNKYYNHGNSAIAEAGFAKTSGYRVWTIALDVDTTGRGILQQMASDDSYFTATASDLNTVFGTIAGEIGAAVKEAKVTDPMGAGFQVPIGEVSNITATQGTPEYNSTTRTITWEPGTLTTPISPGSDIKYAELKYRVELNDDILLQTPDENGEYPTNGSAIIRYTDAAGNAQEKPFPVPRVNPVLYKVVKVLQDKDGNVITVDRDFDIKITGPWADGVNEKIFTLNPFEQSGTKLLTDLRWDETYTFSETSTNVGNLADYDITYIVNGVETNSFVVAGDQTEDVEVKVVNKEKPGSITIIKKLDQSAIIPPPSPAKMSDSGEFGLTKSGAKTSQVKFDFEVIGPNGYAENFSLPENNSWEKVLDGLAKGIYTIKETTTGWTTTMQVNQDPEVSASEVNVTLDFPNLKHTVTVTNKQTENMTVTAEKIWEYAPTDKPDIWFQLIRINSDNSETFVGEPKKVVNNSVTWNQSDTGLTEKLLKYDENGNLYSYKVQEVDEDGNDFVPAGYSKVENGLTVTNSFIQTSDTDITSIRFEKTWEGVPENLTPPNITVQVIANSPILINQVVRTAVLTYPNVVVEWKDLPLKDAEENIITYTINEKPINDFNEGDPVVTESAIENVYCEPSQNQTDWPLQNPAFIITRITGHKAFVVWTLNHVPAVDQVQLLRNVIAASKPAQYKQPLKDLESYLDQGGDAFIWLEGPNVSHDVLPNNPSSGLITVEVTFNPDGTVNETTIHFQGENIWTHFAVGSYSTKLVEITNTYNQETINLQLTKTWSDNNNQDGIRPAQVEFNIYDADDMITIVRTVTLTPENGVWQQTVTGLPKYKNFTTLINYVVVEVVPDDYIETHTQNGNNWAFKNTYTPATTEKTVSKVWDDNNNQDGKRTDVTLKLVATVDGTEVSWADLKAASASGADMDDDGLITLTGMINESHKFTNLPVKYQGKDIVYTVVEPTVPTDYTESYDQQTLTVTNTYKPATTEKTVSKVWDDNNNQDGKRTDVTLKLVATVDGTEVSWADLKAASASGADMDDDGLITLTGMINESHKFTNLPVKYQGKDIVYTVVEPTVPTDYTESYDQQTLTVTNTYKPATTEKTVSKVWDDNNNQDGKRTDVTLKLVATVDGTEVSWADLKAASASGADMDDDGLITLTGMINESHKFTNLPVKYQGKDIVYTVVEPTVPTDYTESYDQQTLTVTNTYKPATTEKTVSKVWDDNNNQDGKRTDVTLKLVATVDGTEVSWADLKAASASGADMDEDGLVTLTSKKDESHTFENLPVKYQGKDIVYTVVEPTVPTDYTENYDQQTLTVTNTYKPATTEKTVSKVWDDNNNQDGKRTDVTLKLVATVDGTEVSWADLKAASASGADMDDDGLITLTGMINESHKFTNLPVKYQGKDIVYTVVEPTVPTDYTESYDQQTLTVTNTYKPATTEKTVSKVWDDNNNQDGKRTDVTLKLVATVDGTEVSWADLKAASASGADMDDDGLITLTGMINESHKFTNLPVKYQGKDIVYTVVEPTVPTDYTESYDQQTLTVTNTYKPATTEKTVSKVWDDNNNQDGKRTDVTLKLVATVDGTEVSWADLKAASASGADMDDDGLITLTGMINESHKFTNLPVKYQGKDIVYTVVEPTVPTGYTESYDQDNLTVTNTHTPATINVSVKKIWDDAENQDGKRPAEITINLYKQVGEAEPTLVESKTVKAKDDWSCSFNELPKYEGGVEIKYIVTEDTVDGYDDALDYSVNEKTLTLDVTITNCHKPIVVEISVTKTWEDEDNVYDTRPDSITIRLWADGKEIASKEVTEKDGWSWSFKGFPKFKDGKEIKYTVTEDAVSGYTSEITGDQASGYVVTNTYTPVPPTGDNFKPMIWITVMIISLILIVILNVYKNEYIKKLYMKI